MKNTPLYLNDAFMSIYRFALMFSFMLGFSSIFAGMAYALFTSSIGLGFFLFIKGAGITALISFIGFIGLWKKHQFEFEKCKENKTEHCRELGFFSLA
ncbi:MAG: hypothetical protein COA44_14465 [Arcobacter sp.]|nr:MAG: hypothetical protein COA44_14465 [Arcobacter sp.]